MDVFLILLGAAMVWLLWSIHQDLLEANQRQRDMRMELVRVVERLDAALASARSRDAADGNPPAAARVNINTADKAELRTLPQIGAATAERIIAARPFLAVDELKRVNGINDALFDKLSDRVSVD